MATNNCVFKGTLGKDAQWRAGKDGKEFLTFNLGVPMGKNADGSYKESLWLSCAANNVSDKLMPYLGKGAKIVVIGSLGVPKVTEKDGKSYVNVPFNVYKIDLCDSADEEPKAGADRPAPGRPAPGRAKSVKGTPADDIAF